ncbi:hypothetical protein SUGI_0030580 [Cryptomeria japonica]|nr:hypothetical protein SUGI_0030580 [Cryptomeria japonica]
MTAPNNTSTSATPYPNDIGGEPEHATLIGITNDTEEDIFEIPGWEIRTTPNIRVNIASTGRQLGTPYGDSGHEGPSTSHREEGLTIVTPSMVDTTIRIGYPHNFDQSQFERTSTSFEELASTAFGVDTAQDTARGDTATGSDEHMHETGGSGPRPGDKRDTATGSDEHMHETGGSGPRPGDKRPRDVIDDST